MRLGQPVSVNFEYGSARVWLEYLRREKYLLLDAVPEIAVLQVDVIR